MVIGVIFFGYIIASVAASLANADTQRARFQEKLSAIKRYLEVTLSTLRTQVVPSLNNLEAKSII